MKPAITIYVSKNDGPQMDGHSSPTRPASVVAAKVCELAELACRKYYNGAAVTITVTEDYTHSIVYGNPAEVIQHIEVPIVTALMDPRTWSDPDFDVTKIL